jgi:hypothetical protein
MKMTATPRNKEKKFAKRRKTKVKQNKNKSIQKRGQEKKEAKTTWRKGKEK